ncbi:MAG TPA: SPOR domain-containing protein [Flavobacterium sp.]|uniref:SPOR domain-containing protein n=1 Tax=Flavobacterium sp. TaxID=239 RepID=UPI002B4ACBE5|nr:SPOR domain-containing protein [Flavobacterium sp.]HLO74061.1 SPOR domain-containing protein [Flavobacterium sp.]
MKNLQKHNLLFFLILSTIFFVKTNAQEIKTSINQDPKFEQMLKEKRKINVGLASNEAYKIQIFYGNSDDSKKKLQEFKKEFKDIDGTIVYTNPNYKVWVGNFETRIEVEKAMLEIKKKYPTALIIKPSK